jgi:hypothetical protein
MFLKNVGACLGRWIQDAKIDFILKMEGLKIKKKSSIYKIYFKAQTSKVQTPNFVLSTARPEIISMVCCHFWKKQSAQSFYPYSSESRSC